MNEPAPKRIIQSAEQPTQELHETVGGELSKFGHNVSTQPESTKPIPLTEELQQIGTDVTHITGSTVEELITGKGGSTRDRTAKNPFNLVWERLKRKKASQQKKAA